MKTVIAALALSGLAASAASAQVNSFTLNDGLFRYSVGAVNGGATARTGTGAGLSTNFGLASGTGAAVTADQLYQHHFWYRSAGDTREFALSNMTASFALGGNSIFNRYVEPIGGSTTAGTLTFELTYTLNQITSTSAAVTINWSIVNNSNSSQTVNFFSYADSDIGSSASNDSGSYTSGSGVNFYRNDDVVPPGNGSFFTMGADLRLNNNWNIGPYSTSATSTTSPLAFLINSSVNNLTNFDSAAGAADNCAALQWQDMVIDAGGTVGGRVTLGYNYVVPTPGAAARLGLGGLAAFRRRRA